MNVSEQFRANLERLQVNDFKERIIKKSLLELDEAECVNSKEYTSIYDKRKKYTSSSTASLSRLIESKKISNEDLSSKLGWGKNRISHIRQCKYYPSREELSELCIVLDLKVNTIYKLFRAFGYLLDTDERIVDISLIFAADLRELTPQERLSIFRSLIN